MNKACGGVIKAGTLKFYGHGHSTEDEIMINVHPSVTIVPNFKNIEELVQGIVEILTDGKDKPV